MAFARTEVRELEPMVKAGKKKFVRYQEGAELYSMGLHTFEELAKEAGAIYKIPDLNVWPNYEDLLETCFNLIIGVELIKMMYSHSPQTVFEVLLFAIARQIIIDHSSIWSSLVGVCAIAVLFATRKFLFCNFDDADKYIFHASAKAKNIARLLSIDLPYSENDTLEEVMLDQLKKENINNEIGACVYFKSFGLRIAKKSDGKISRIEVIRAIH